MSNTFRTLDDLCRIPSSAPTTRETADHAELAACPFCGLTDSDDNATQEAGVSVRPFRSSAGGTACRVECACGASGPSKREDWAATEAWNRRDPQSALLSEIAALRGEVEGAHQKYVDANEARIDAERQRDEAARHLSGMLEAYHLLCDDAGKPYYESASSKYAAARAFLANQGADQ